MFRPARTVTGICCKARAANLEQKCQVGKFAEKSRFANIEREVRFVRIPLVVHLILFVLEKSANCKLREKSSPESEEENLHQFQVLKNFESDETQEDPQSEIISNSKLILLRRKVQ